MKLRIKYHKQFLRDYAKAIKRGFDKNKLSLVLEYLCNNELLPSKYKDYSLVDSKKYKKCRECHIEPDWLLVYKIEKEELVLELFRTGTHSDLFG